MSLFIAASLAANGFLAPADSLLLLRLRPPLSSSSSLIPQDVKYVFELSESLSELLY